MTHRSGWSVWALTWVLYPLGWGAVAVNLFFASLIFSWIGLPVLPPTWAVIIAAPLGLPASYGFSKHLRKLMDRVDAETQ